MKTPQFQRQIKYQLLKLRRRRKLPLIIAALVILLTLAAHIYLAVALATDLPGDGTIYSQLAKNLLEQKVYSLDAAAPFVPTLIRLPGYPLFLAAIYAVFGHGNETAVRVIQAMLHTATCGLVGLLAWNWVADKKRRMVAAWAAFALAALCPFTLIYIATLLTETVTTFLMAAMTLTATYAFKSLTKKSAAGWWIFTGLLAGTAVLMRPDSGLFAFGIGLTLVIVTLFGRHDLDNKFPVRVWQTLWQGAIFSIAFSLPLIPWTIRNEQVFQVFQPLAPSHAEAPGEFVSLGYYRWVRTWIDDQKYIAPMLWYIGEKPIKIEHLPASAFDSEEEKTQVANLINQYNNSSPNPPPAPGNQKDSKSSSGKNNSADNADDKDSADSDDSSDSDDKDGNGDDDKSDDKAGNKSDDSGDDDEDADQTDTDAPLNLKISPDVDAQFEQIAGQRIAREPFRYYIWLPAKRASALWFDTHSAYYPFDGELLPLKDLDNEENQELWLPLFAALVWVYTFLALIGTIFLWRGGGGQSRRWLLLFLLMTLPRILFFATLENPEPRYVVELFAFTAILGSIALARLKFRREAGKFSLELFYGKE